MPTQSAEQIGAAVAEEVSTLPAAETPSQHIRNAMGSLYTLERVERHDDEPGFFVSDDTLCAVYRRLWKAVKDLEAFETARRVMETGEARGGQERRK